MRALSSSDDWRNWRDDEDRLYSRWIDFVEFVTPEWWAREGRATWVKNLARGLITGEPMKSRNALEDLTAEDFEMPEVNDAVAEWIGSTDPYAIRIVVANLLHFLQEAGCDQYAERVQWGLDNAAEWAAAGDDDTEDGT